jgi:hypothetical protein
MNLHQLKVHLVHSVDGEQRWGAKGLGRDGLILAPLMASRGRHLLVSSLSGGKAHYQEPLHLKHGLMPRRGMWLNRGSGLLADELASRWHCL